jgi:hypothetical protein
MEKLEPLICFTSKRPGAREAGWKRGNSFLFNEFGAYFTFARVKNHKIANATSFL